MSDLGSIPYSFGAFCLDPAEFILLRDDEPIALTPKEFDTLVALVEAKGRVVGKEEIIGRVWPDTYVSDGSLARNISVLRKALGDDVIETIPRRGYRITLPVRLASAGEESLPHGSGGVSDEQARPAPGWKRRFIVASAIATLLLISVASRILVIHTSTAGSRPPSSSIVGSLLIQKEGATDPSDEGFKIHAFGKFENRVMHNLDNHGFDRLQVISDDRGYYYRTLSSAEKDFALQRNWRLICVCAVQRGAAFANIDFGVDKGALRFDINLLQEGGRYFVALTKQISPQDEWEQKVEFSGVGDIDHPHTYELRYDHVSRTASLWIDGQMAASGYRGLSQFRENRGIYFGAGSYLDVTPGIGVFRTVRFEAN
jgi:DNA-binding winged helix-turn-helix (wHTH) protein